jgi:hypothetical protein
MYARRQPALGWVAAIPVAYSALMTTEKLLFGAGAARDQVRDARAQWFTQAALLGSITAARILVAGLTKTGGVTKEIERYQRGIAQVRASGPDGAALIDRAQQLGGFWIDGDNETSDQMRAAVTRELQSMDIDPGTVPNSTAYSSGSTMPGGTVQGLPAVRTTAPFNWTPVFIVGGAVAVALLASQSGKRKR